MSSQAYPSNQLNSFYKQLEQTGALDEDAKQLFSELQTMSKLAEQTNQRAKNSIERMSKINQSFEKSLLSKVESSQGQTDKEIKPLGVFQLSQGKEQKQEGFLKTVQQKNQEPEKKDKKPLKIQDTPKKSSGKLRLEFLLHVLGVCLVLAALWYFMEPEDNQQEANKLNVNVKSHSIYGMSGNNKQNKNIINAGNALLGSLSDDELQAVSDQQTMDKFKAKIMFKKLDEDHNNYVSKDQIKSYLQKSLGHELDELDFKDLIKQQFDFSLDNRENDYNLQEFEVIYRKLAKESLKDKKEHKQDQF